MGSRQEVRVIALHQAGGQLLLLDHSFYSNSAECCPPCSSCHVGNLICSGAGAQKWGNEIVGFFSFDIGTVPMNTFYILKVPINTFTLKYPIY